MRGRCPPLPDESSSIREKGIYGLFLMMLFRPHRGPRDLVQRTFATAIGVATEDDAWAHVYSTYQQWRRVEVDEVARSWLDMNSHDSCNVPVFGTKCWWRASSTSGCATTTWQNHPTVPTLPRLQWMSLIFPFGAVLAMRCIRRQILRWTRLLMQRRTQLRAMMRAGHHMQLLAVTCPQQQRRVPHRPCRLQSGVGSYQAASV